MRQGNVVERATRIYECSKPGVNSIPVHHQEFYEFHRCLTGIEKKLQVEAIEDEYLRRPNRIFRRFRFEACATTLDFKSSFLWRKTSPEQLQNELENCNTLYPEFWPLFANLFRSLEALMAQPVNALQTEVLQSCNSEKKKDTAVLLPEAHLVRPVRDAIKARLWSMKNLTFISPAGLTGDEVFDRIIVLGPPRWYPSFVFSASRTKQLHLINYEWLHDEWKPQSAFGEFESVAGSPAGTYISTRLRLTPGITRPSDILPVSHVSGELHSLVSRFQRSDEDRQGAESLSMRLFVLENGYGVFLEELNSARIQIVDLSETTPVQTVSVADVSTGTFLVLRTRGGGDYIALIADRLLGEEAKQRRERQEVWKAKLRSVVEREGINVVCRRLTGVIGSKIGSSHIRYWMWSGAIGPKDPMHFAVMMKILGMDALTVQSQDDINILRAAHQQAGQQIRNQLLQLVSHADLSQLRETGVMEFTLGNYDGGSITAVRVVQRTDIVLDMPARRARQLFDIEEAAWHD